MGPNMQIKQAGGLVKIKATVGLNDLNIRLAKNNFGLFFCLVGQDFPCLLGHNTMLTTSYQTLKLKYCGNIWE